MTDVRIQDDGGDGMNVVDVNGFIVPRFTPNAEKVKQVMDSLPNYEFRDDDIMLCTFPKAGRLISKISIGKCCF